MKKKKILLWGYIGRKNFGDDLLFEIALKNLEHLENKEIFVLLPKEIEANYLSKINSELNIIKYNKSIAIFEFLKYHKVYYIGGGVFFDYKKNIGLVNFFKRRFSNFLRFNISRYFGTEFAGVGLGIGPYYSKKTKSISANILKNFSLIGVRDAESLKYAKEFRLKNVFLANDLSLLLHKDLLKLKKTAIKIDNKILICPRTYPHKKDFEKHLDILKELTVYLQKKLYNVEWIFLQEENELLIKELEGLKIKTRVWNPDEMKLSDFMSHFASASLVFTSRMHAVYISNMLKTKTVAIDVHPKLVHSSKLFYRNPIIVNPLSELKIYKEAMRSDNQYDNEEFIKDYKKVDEVNFKIIKWLNVK
ncbi:polysaccharide pyruvyl transferase family protein [Polaribacter sp. Hel_I_88]|uniref:polysaccharide pyruvyl transferase family protein n=1 Tax=Polaribacter sp. Hel_I_88 TaxID=1250006 RepID=UPI0004798EEB|nr:polysaccharide pyruvyl transferase family protein [Polaribacter sp. Hel_I_88]